MALVLSSCSEKPKYDYPFRNPELPVEERVENLVSLLSTDEKIGLMMNGSISVDRLGIPAYNWWSEACHGICTDDVTVFPQAIALAATFDTEQQYDIYTAISDEARAQWNTTDHNEFGKLIADGGWWQQGLTFWCPNVNIFRDPRWGRGQETSGEDPYLSSVMGEQVVRGMQGDNPKYYKTHACAKHYAVHSGPEPIRHKFDAKNISHRDLWETYLPAFHSLVNADVREVMCAYNRYEGEPCCGNKSLLVDILRNKWNYQGLVVSDCGAINNFYYIGDHETHPDAASASADAVLKGTDIECGWSYYALTESLKKGLLNESDIDVSIRRIMKGRIELGMFDPQKMDPWRNLGREMIASDEHAALALKAAHESMTLLKNDGVLPLSKAVRTVAVVGPNADNTDMHLGNYNGYPKESVNISILDAIRKEIPDAEIIYEKGCELAEPYVIRSILGELNDGKGLKADFYNNSTYGGDVVSSGYYDKVQMMTFGSETFAEGVNKNFFSAKFSGAWKADFTGRLYYNIRSVDHYKLFVNGSVIESQYSRPDNVQRPRPQTPEKYIEVKEGNTYKFEIEYSNKDEGAAYIDFEMCTKNAPDFNGIAEKAGCADVIIMVSGISSRLEGEEMKIAETDGFVGGDRTKIELPETQRKLLASLKNTGKPVVLVNCSGSAMAFGEDEANYNALLQAWYAGQATGTAVADVLFGDYNPAGRLPVTFYASTAQLPDFEDYSMDNRTYRYFTGKPLYPFGYGLSYTQFEYGKANLSKDEIKSGKSVDITIPVTNAGDRDGDEVVQVYVKSLNNSEAPIKSLKGFERVNIPSGKTAKVKITLGPDAFEFYDKESDGLKVFPGRYLIMYGSSSSDEDLNTVELNVI